MNPMEETVKRLDRLEKALKTKPGQWDYTTQLKFKWGNTVLKCCKCEVELTHAATLEKAIHEAWEKGWVGNQEDKSITCFACYKAWLVEDRIRGFIESMDDILETSSADNKEFGVCDRLRNAAKARMAELKELREKVAKLEKKESKEEQPDVGPGC